MKSRFIKDLEENEKIESDFSVKYKKPLKPYKSGWMFILGLSDKTGEIEAKYWGGEDKNFVKDVYNQITPGDVLRIKGTVSEFKGRLQINIEEGEGSIKKLEIFDIEDFVEKSRRDIEKMFSELKEEMSTIKNPHLKRLMDEFLNDKDFIERFKRAPAAMFYHHAYIGGLMEHVLNMIHVAKALKDRYDYLDLDLIKVGCFIHDIGKIKEFEVTTNIKQSRHGLLRGHMSLGEEILLEKINKMGNFPENLKHKLLHIIISHHGSRENGSVVPPMFPEAAAVYYLDELDSKIRQYIDLKENADTDDFHIWTKRFGQIYLE
ncbi:MAG: HD domain-containing protein [Candidatus Aenigmarchaeota archaeon]|nr:HD domain-containing protein [Candidatus Aenigmarchaeota archaeon]